MINKISCLKCGQKLIRMSDDWYCGEVQGCGTWVEYWSMPVIGKKYRQVIQYGKTKYKSNERGYVANIPYGCLIVMNGDEV